MTGARLRRPAHALMATMLVSALLVSCTGSSSRPTLGADPLQTAIDAMKAAGSGHINGVITGPNGKGSGAIETDWKGDLTGEFSGHVDFISDAGKKIPVDVRLVKGAFYFSRTVGALPGDQTYSIFVRDAGAKPWRKLSTGGIFDGVISLFSPLATLQWIKRLGVSVTSHPGERVGSVTATRLTTKTRLLLGPFLASTISIWVDGKGRVLRVATSNPASGGARYDVTDLGGAVRASPPPASEVATKSELPEIGPSGPFTTVKAGTTGTVTWALQRSPGTQGTVCWRWQATPPLPQTQLKSPTTPRCLVPPPAKSDDPSDTVQFVVIGNGTGSYDAIVVLLPPGVKHLTFGLVGGKLESLPVTSPLVWVGPSQPTKAYLGVTLANGHLMDCGAGAVSVPSDLTDPSLTGAVSNAAWGCLPPA